MRKMKKRTICITVIFIVWLAIIFSFSAMTANSSTDLTDLAINIITDIREKSIFIDEIFLKLTENHSLFYIIRKLAHVFVFCMLEIIAFFMFKHFGFSIIKSSIFSICCVFLYACTDEFHQLFVSGRSGQISDIAIDTLGGLIGLSISLFTLLIKNMLKRILCIFLKK